MLKHLVSRELPHPSSASPFWQPRYYDLYVFTRRKWTEKLRYLHRNPVTRALVAAPEDWVWSSYRHWATGEEAPVEIESEWTFRKRERIGIKPTFLRSPE